MVMEKEHIDGVNGNDMLMIKEIAERAQKETEDFYRRTFRQSEQYQTAFVGFGNHAPNADTSVFSKIKKGIDDSKDTEWIQPNTFDEE